MPAARHIGVRVFVDQQQAGPSRQRRVEIELLNHLIAVDDRLARQHVEASRQLLGLTAAMGLDQPGDYVTSARPLAMRGREHGVGLADPRRCAEKNLEPAPAFLLGQGQQCIGGSSLRLIAGHTAPRRSRSYDFIASSARLSLSTFTRGSPSRPSQRP